MANEKRNNTFRPRFNIYWMWGIILVIILGWAYLGGGGQQSKINWDVLRDTLLPSGHVEKVQVLNKETAQVYLAPRSVAFYKNQERYRYIPDRGPQFYFNIGSLEKFENDYQAARDSIERHQQGELGPKVSVPALTFENESSGWSTFLWQVLPFLLIVVFWIVIMRRMSGGAGGGAGGGLRRALSAGHLGKG